MLKVLVVDDQPAVRTALQVLFEVHGIPSLLASSPDEVLDLIQTEDVGVVLQDMNFSEARTSGEEGVALFRSIRKLDPDVPVLLMTAWTSLETAVSLIKEGAADYVAKPWNDEKLALTVRNLLRMRELQQDNIRLRAQKDRARKTLAGKFDLGGLIYASEAMQSLVTLAVNVAPSDAPILVSGPNGSGKEKIAEIVQANSRRRAKPFVRVNAGGLPDQLLEAELFGAEAGAFTGATKLRVGRFEAADGGTIFLDEIGNLSLTGQARLLRVLQTGEYERLGSSTPRRCDVRLISATNLDLPKAIADGRFREDLYYRLNVVELFVPSLADRPEDVIPLAEHFLKLSAAESPHAGTRQLDESALAALLLYDWPGNVRELQNRMRRASLVAGPGPITAAELGLPGAAAPQPKPSAEKPPAAPEHAASDDPERVAIEEALREAGGVVLTAAARLGLSRQALYRRMEKLGVSVERRLKR